MTPTAEFDPSHPQTQRALRILAEEAARTGGQVARQYFRGPFGVRLKHDQSEVSDADEAAQAAIVACIRALRPCDAFIAEETLHFADVRAGASPEACSVQVAYGSSALSRSVASSLPPPPRPSNEVLCWVIDPIDGTRNFVRGISLFACSVAVMFGGTPLVGAVYDPQRDVLYSASQSEGLFVSGEPRPAERGAAGRAQRVHPRPVVGIPSMPIGATAPLVHAWLDRYVCRNLGTTALHLAMVATGELDGTLSDNCRLWDIAAGWVLVTAAGGTMTTINGGTLFPLDVSQYNGEEMPNIAARDGLHPELVGGQGIATT